jgi:uncharacterized protein YkwD
MQNHRIYPVFTLVVLVLIGVLSGCGGSGNSSCDSSTPLDTTTYTLFQQKTLDEINLVRTSPADYADKRLKDDYNAGRDNGAYLVLKDSTPVGRLALQEQLCRAASKYAQYLAEHNAVGHEADKRTPDERCKAEGYKDWSGENFAAGSSDELNADRDPETAAIEFVLQLIIDEGVADVGHRRNIMYGGHKVIGVGFYRNPSSTYVNYTVQDFGDH